MNPTPNTAEQSTLATVPLNLLRMDNDNVRGRTDDPASRQADAELAASIRAQGLLENLVVVPRGKTQYGVVAGGRRYRALKALVEIGAIPKDHPVPCLVVDRSRAAESSLAENVVRVAMHPVDQVVAFTRLADAGATTEQIADRFGLAERTVRKRLRLGRLPREILDAYREGAINAAVAEAFAVTGDTNHQLQAFKSLSQSNSLHVRAVQQTIAQRQLRSDSPAALFVGLDAYRAAGGGIEEPLFEEGYVTVLDATLMTRLAEEKLQDTAARYAADWKWTATQLEFTWADRQQYTIAPAADRAEFTEEESAQRQQASDIIDATGEKLTNLDHDPERREELWAAIREAEERYEAIGRRRADRDEYLEAVRRVSGVIATLDEDGNIEVIRGLVRSEDLDAYRAAIAPAPTAGEPGATSVPGTGPAAAPPRNDADQPVKKNGGYTDALRDDFRIMRCAAVRKALARDPAVAADLLGFVLARQVGFGRRAQQYETPVLSIRRDHVGIYASDAMKASATMKHLEPCPDADLAWLAENNAASAFTAYRALPENQRAAITAHAVANLLLPRLAGDADLVWNRMNKALILGAGATAIGTQWADSHSAFKKKDLAEAAARAFTHDPSRDQTTDRAATRWLPPGFDPADLPCRNGTGHAPLEADSEDDASGTDDANGLPAFLDDD